MGAAQKKEKTAVNMQGKQQAAFIGVETDSQNQESQENQPEAMRKTGMFVKARLFEKQLEM